MAQGLSETRRIFLRSVSSCYLIAFISYYLQIPGLFGSKGLTPVNEKSDGRRYNFNECPTIVWMIRDGTGLDHESILDLLCICGSVFAFLGAVSSGLAAGKIGFIFNWIAYLSLYWVSSDFLFFQWDILLLEVGFLCILLAPFREDGKSRPWDSINLELVRWLLFRMMFANGLVKLTSECPSWWGLKAMPLHYESQCIPTPLSWFAYHYLPEYFHRFSVVWTFVIEIPVSLLFYAPTKGLKKFAYGQQIILMIIIMITGNYNFFNFLFMALCVSLADDSWWTRSSERKGFLVSCITWIFNVAVVVIYVIGILYFFVDETLEFKIKFNINQLQDFIQVAVPVSILCGTLILIYRIVESLYVAIGSFSNLVWTLAYALFAVLIFTLSIRPFTLGLGIDKSEYMSDEITTNINKAYLEIRNFHIVNSYGLFRSMTGVNGRPEVVIEGSYDAFQWKEYHFKYKPGDISKVPKYVLPHQPRLDWQMWFLALSSFYNHPWFISLSHRLLLGETEVLKLLDHKRNPFPEKPPFYLRAKLYYYRFTKPDNETQGWWTRDLIKDDFFPLFTIRDSPLIAFLQNTNLLPVMRETPSKYHLLYKGLAWIRRKAEEVEPHIVVWTFSVITLPQFYKLTLAVFY